MGPLYLAANREALKAISFGVSHSYNHVEKLFGCRFVRNRNDVLELAVSELEEYFAGGRQLFSVPLALEGTPFQKQAWEALIEIPYGSTISYGEQAKRIRKPSASRAVGAANGCNPLGIIIPCHRVIAGSGSLAGYAGGIENKRKLLELEGAIDPLFTAVNRHRTKRIAEAR